MPAAAQQLRDSAPDAVAHAKGFAPESGEFGGSGDGGRRRAALPPGVLASEWGEPGIRVLPRRGRAVLFWWVGHTYNTTLMMII
jgi:hypothetical protein